MFTHKAVLPLRFCEKVGFFSGTDKANGEGETSLGGVPGAKMQKTGSTDKGKYDMTIGYM